MKNQNKSDTIAIGLAMFSMFFGAGNIIFPLAIGGFAADKNHFAIFGLIITAAIIPIAGVIAMVLFDGDYKSFFGRLGEKKGFWLAFIIIALLGPFGSTPRCIALAYSTLKTLLIDIHPAIFCAFSCIIIYFLTARKNKILKILGIFLTPLLLFCLFSIIILGFINRDTPLLQTASNAEVFLYGLNEGYNTMDLLAAFFFSSTIIQILKKESKNISYLKLATHASLIGAILLTIVYVGFSYLAVYHIQGLENAPKDLLLSMITLKVAGNSGSYLAAISIILACLTTAIALISAFTDFAHREVFKNKYTFKTVLISSLIITYFISIFEFSFISSFLSPILQVTYPALIVLTLLNIAYKLWGFSKIKEPVLVVFSLSLIAYLIN